jgi:hypothetical protein
VINRDEFTSLLDLYFPKRDSLHLSSNRDSFGERLSLGLFEVEFWFESTLQATEKDKFIAMLQCTKGSSSHEPRLWTKEVAVDSLEDVKNVVRETQGILLGTAAVIIIATGDSK